MILKGIGPISQILTMDNIALKGPVNDGELNIIHGGALILVDGKIAETGSFEQLRAKYPRMEFTEVGRETVCLPGFIDVHTHICWGGTRSADYASRIAGKSYREISGEGGGINVTVQGTRKASKEELSRGLIDRAMRHLKEGVTTCEVKSGYGLTCESELKILSLINEVNEELPIDLIPTVLSAHIKPFDFEGTSREYLRHVIRDVLPAVKDRNLSDRVDIFTDEEAFSLEDSEYFLQEAGKMGFSMTVHSDQFSSGGSRLAVKCGARSADHLESITEEDIDFLADSETTAVALPGCSLGLGMKFAPARKLLDRGASLVISTDWNPGSAPMGDLLLQASLLSASEKLSTAETLSAITFRAARVLNLSDRGVLSNGKTADLIFFPTSDYRDILYHQGKMKPISIWKKGREI